MYRSPWLRAPEALRRSSSVLVTAAAALALTPGTALADTVVEAETFALSSSSAGAVRSDSSASGGTALKIWSNASASKSVSAAQDTVTVSARARGEQCGGAPRMLVHVDGTQRISALVSNTAYSTFNATFSLPAGAHTVRVAFNNDYKSSSCDRNLIVDKVTLVSSATATPGATPTPTPTATATPTPTPTPTPALEGTGTGTDPVIAAAGDIACDPAHAAFHSGSGSATECRQRATSDLLTTGRFAKVLTLGDNQYQNGTLAAFQQSYDPSWGRVKALTAPAVGNHEYYVSGASGYFDYFNGVGASNGRAGARGKGYYSYDVGGWHLIALNSNCAQVSCAAGSAQEQWLKADLAANPRACTLAYWHHPRFSSGSHGNNTSVAPLYSALYAANADVVLASHDHSYERFARQNPSGGADSSRGIRQFVVGTGGRGHYGFGSTPQPNSQVRLTGTFGVLALTLRPTSYDWKFLAEAGRTATDAGTTTCH